jgi:hypothetical protein
MITWNHTLYAWFERASIRAVMCGSQRKIARPVSPTHQANGAGSSLTEPRSVITLRSRTEEKRQCLMAVDGG